MIQLNDNPKLLIHPISDIHLEFLEENWFTVTKPDNPQNLVTCCILAGDIGHPGTSKYRSFLADAKTKFDHVIVIAGNHEYYNHKDMKSTEAMMTQDCLDTGCIFLNRSSVVIEGYKFIGATLWADIPSRLFSRMNGYIGDFNNIICDGESFTPIKFNRLHKRDFDFFKNEINTIDYPIIAISHHAPTYEIVQSKYRDRITTCAYASNMEHLIRDPVKLWINGHLHNTDVIEINGTTCVTNCKGYETNPPENIHFDPKLSISI